MTKDFLRATYRFKSVRAPRWAPHLFSLNNIFLLPCMACCRGNRPENGLAFSSIPAWWINSDMPLTTTCFMTDSGIFSPPIPTKCQSTTTWCYTLISGSYQRYLILWLGDKYSKLLKQKYACMLISHFLFPHPDQRGGSYCVSPAEECVCVFAWIFVHALILFCKEHIFLGGLNVIIELN